MKSEAPDDTMLDGSELARWTLRVSRMAHALASTDPTWDTVHVEDELIGRIDARKHGALLAIQRHDQEMADRGITIRPAEPKPEKPARPRHPVAAEIMDRLAGVENEIEDRAVALAIWHDRAQDDWPLIEWLAALIAYNDAQQAIKQRQPPVELVHPPIEVSHLQEHAEQQQLAQKLRTQHSEAHFQLIGMGRGNLEFLVRAHDALLSGSSNPDAFDDRWARQVTDAIMVAQSQRDNRYGRAMPGITRAIHAHADTNRTRRDSERP